MISEAQLDGFLTKEQNRFVRRWMNAKLSRRNARRAINLTRTQQQWVFDWLEAQIAATQEQHKYVITVKDICGVFGCVDRTVWRWLENPTKLPFFRKIGPHGRNRIVHHYILEDVITRIESVRDEGVSIEENDALRRIAAEYTETVRESRP